MTDYPATDAHGNPRTPYAVFCRGGEFGAHGLVYLTFEQYDWQMCRANSLWECPICREAACWEDDNYEELMFSSDEEEGC